MSVCYCGQVEIPLGMTMCKDPRPQNHVVHGVTACVGAGTDWERRALTAEAEVERLRAEVERLRAEVERLTADLAEEHRRYEESFPDLIRLSAEVERLTAELADRDRRIQAALALHAWGVDFDSAGNEIHHCDIGTEEIDDACPTVQALRGESDE